MEDESEVDLENEARVLTRGRLAAGTRDILGMGGDGRQIVRSRLTSAFTRNHFAVDLGLSSSLQLKSLGLLKKHFLNYLFHAKLTTSFENINF